MARFSDLPHDVLSHTLTMCTPREIGRFAQVSRSLQACTEDDFIWKAIALKSGAREHDLDEYATWREYVMLNGALLSLVNQ